MPKKVVKKFNPGWIQQKKKRVLKPKQKKNSNKVNILSMKSNERPRTIQTLRLEPVRGAKRFGNITGLLDNGADDPVISKKVANSLGCIVRRTTVWAFDAGGCVLPISGETDIFFSCPCDKHKDNRKIAKTALVLKKILLSSYLILLLRTSTL